MTPFELVNRELLINLAGGRAVLLELAHPLVAAGVALHSGFQQHPFRRLWRTWIVMTHITWGDAEERRRALQTFHGGHAHVHGRLPAKSGQFAAGSYYHAHDPELKRWVLATLIDSALLAYETFVAPLAVEEKQAYYDESLSVAHWLGIPRSLMPKAYPEFVAYMESMIAGESLHVGEHARQIVAAWFGTRLLRPLVKTARYFGVGLLPRRLREEYQFHWRDSDETRWQRVAARLRRLRKILPDALCVNPQAWLSESYSKRTEGEREATGSQRFFA